MDGKSFDRIVMRLGTDASRRQLLGGLIGAAAAVLAGATVLEAKPRGKGKGKGRKKGQGNGNGNGNGGNGNGNGNGQGLGTEKVQICHRNNGRRRFNLITVGAPAAAAHERHGDTVCDEEELADCEVFTGCDDDGECVAGPAPEGTPCVTVDGNGEEVSGTCDEDGACVADDGDDEEPVP
jgi:hypothetical protein